MKTLPPLPPEWIDRIIEDVQETITLDMEAIEFDEDFMPPVYDDIPLREFVKDYVDGLKFLMNKLIETKDIRYFDIVCSLMPTEMFLRYKGILDGNTLKSLDPTKK